MSLEIAADAAKQSYRRKPWRRLTRVDGRTRQARKALTLEKTYAERLGKAASDPSVKADVERLAELEATTWSLRARVMRGDPTVDLITLDRLERLADRKRRALGLDKPPRIPPKPLSSYLRGDK